MGEDIIPERWGKCYTCEREITAEEEDRAREVSGLSLCPACLEEELKPKDRCASCGKTGVELNRIVGLGNKVVCLECCKSQQEGGCKTMSELANFAKRNSQYISLADGESFEGEYRGFKVGVNTLDPSKEVVIYQFETEYGVKSFKSGSCALARLFDNVAKDSHIKITRTGEGNQTKYKLEMKTEKGWHIVEKAEEE